jgi:hypothetical protein
VILKPKWSRILGLGGAILVVPGHAWSHRVQSDPSAAQQESEALKAPQQLDDLVAPIALYADPLIAQILAAATYPLEIVEADRWAEANPSLTATDLTDAAKTQPWDPSVQTLVAFPSVLAILDRNLSWTTDLGNAFLAQPQGVMDAIQRQRQRAFGAGKLLSNAQETVVRSSEDNTIEVEPADPDEIYVPVYDPVVVWGGWSYHPWGPFWYPARPVGAVIGIGPGFFIGIAVGRSFHDWGGWGGWGWGCSWRDLSLTVNNNFYIHYNYRPPQNVLRNGVAAWVHDPRHRQGVAYPSAQVAGRFVAPAGRRSPGGGVVPPQGVPAKPPTPPRANGGALAGTNVSGSRARVESDRGHASLSSSSHSAAAAAPRSSGGKPHK